MNRGRPPIPKERLTKRQIQIGTLLSSGLLLKEIAGELGITCKTVETHTKQMRYRLNARTLAHLVHLMHERKYLSVGDR